MEIYIFSNANDQATHRRSTSFYTTGYRVPRQIDASKLTENASRLLSLMENDLSGLLEGDDLVPRAMVHEWRIDIREAAEILGVAADRAMKWHRAYGSHVEPGIEARGHRFYGLDHASQEGTLEAAINAAAEHPGLHVRASLHSPSVPVNGIPLHDDRQRSAKAWAHMLRVA